MGKWIFVFVAAMTVFFGLGGFGAGAILAMIVAVISANRRGDDARPNQA